MVLRRQLALALAAVLLGVLAGCGDAGGSGGSGGSGGGSDAADPAPPWPSGEARDELAAHDGRPCPKRLPQADRHGFGPDEPAESAPSLPAADAAWVCEYRPTPDGREGDGTRWGWVRHGDPAEVDPARLARLERLVGRLAPADEDRMCTADLGPRWMLVLSRAGDLTGVVVDAFGCRDVRLTDDPHATVPGEGTQGGAVPGVLTGSPDLLPAIRTAAGT